MSVSVAYLEQINEERRQKFDLEPEGVWRIGRGRHNSIDLKSETVSRNHAIIQAVEAGTYYLSDVGSQNGTFANRKPVTAPVQLHEGDHIAIGDCTFDFHLSRARQEDLLGIDSPSIVAETAVNLKLRMITVLVVDVRRFTEIAAGISTVQLGEMMRSYFREVGQMLEAKGVWAQKYIGDAVMAIWVHEPRQKQSPVVAAVESLTRIQAIAAGLQRRFHLQHPVRIGAGINTGFASIGNIGSSACADYTALGETVIKAFRLEKCTREIGSEVVVGRETASELEQIAGRKFLSGSTMLLKGFSDVCQVYGTDVRSLVTELSSHRNSARIPAPALQ